MNRVIRTAAATPTLKSGNVAFNLTEIKNCILRARKSGVELLVLPELCLTGCSCGDLILYDAITNAVKDAPVELAPLADGIAFIVGAPLAATDGDMRDCACLFADKQLRGIVMRDRIPRPDYFSRARLFSTAPASFDIMGKHYEAHPISTFDINGTRIAVSIGDSAPEVNADLICLLDAAPAFVGSADERTYAVCKAAQDLKIPLIYAAASADESTADFICSGQLIISNGKPLAATRGCVCSNGLITADVALGAICEDELSAPVQAVNARYPFIPDNIGDVALQILEIQSEALARRLKLTGCRPVIGVSGGLDSTMALLVAVTAVEKLNRPTSDVLGITMPCFGTSNDTFNNSLSLMRELGIEARTVRIGDSVRQHLRDIGHAEDVFDAAYENAQARERTQVLMDVANMVGGIVIGTGDLSESALGWCTYNGDHMSMYSVNASLPKTLIQRTVRALAATDRFRSAAKTLLAVVDQPISPELLPPDAKNGKIAQKTEDIVGPYELHDFFIYHLLKNRHSPQKIFESACAAFGDSYDADTVKKWLSVFLRRFFTQQFKRSCSPDGVCVQPLNLSPRIGWAVPSDIDGSMWK